MMENHAAYLTEVGKIELGPAAMPTVGPEDLLVEIGAVGICGSDVHFFKHGEIGAFKAEMPFILGHECAGVVVQTGEGVTGFAPGDRVVLEPGVPCGKCELCLSGHYNLCDDVVFMATPPYQGCLARYVSHPAAFSFKMPENMSMIEGALVEPLAIGINAAFTGRVKLGDTVFISGAGCIGLMSALAARACGAARVILSDTLDIRLQFAERLGAKTINAKNTDVVQQLRLLTNGWGADVVIDCVGAQQTAQQATKLVRKAGHIVFVGLAQPEVDGFSVNDLINTEAEVHAIFRYKNLFPTTISAIASGLINVKSMVTNEYPFAETHRGFYEAATKAAQMVKGVITF